MVSSCHVKVETYRLYWSLKNKNRAIYYLNYIKKIGIWKG